MFNEFRPLGTASFSIVESLPDLRPSNSPIRGRSSLVFWPGHNGHDLIPLADPAVVRAVGIGLALASRNRRLIGAARDRGFGVMPDPERWRSQLPPEHRLRSAAYRNLGYDQDKGRYRPEQDKLTDSSADEIAAAVIDAHVYAGATILPAPGHVLESSSGRGLRNDLLLAGAARREFDRRALAEPAASDSAQARRALFGSLFVFGKHLDPRAISTLADAYAELDLDGHLIWSLNFGNSAKQLPRIIALAQVLEERTDTPSVVAGLGQLFQGALRHRVAGACFGPERGRMAWPPPDDPPEDDADSDEEKDKGRRFPVFHPAILGAFPIRDDWAPQRNATFLADPCDCTHHKPDIPPPGRSEERLHNVVWTMRVSREACQGDATTARAALAEQARHAERRRALMGMRPLYTAWRAASSDLPEELRRLRRAA